jgi:RHS repeat-associated protein
MYPAVDDANMPPDLRSPTARMGTHRRALTGGPHWRCHPRCVKQTVTLSNNAPTSLMGGTTWYLHGENNALVFEKELKANGVTENRHYLQAAGMTFALVTTRSGAGVSSTASDLSKRSAQVRYFHQDHLNSMAVVTDEVGLIHMNGRVYDPLIGRFMSADPFIQSPSNLQSYNRYAYVMNNPLAFSDPSGYWRLRISIGGITIFSVSSQTLVRAVAMSADVFLGCSGYCSAAVGAHYGAQNGGGLAGAIVGGVSGYYAYQFAGNYSWQAYAVAAATGCASAEVQGGSCGRGAASGLISKGASQVGDATGYEWTAAAAGGCASSRIGGGSCTDGIAQAWGSMATSYVMMGAVSELKTAYARYQYSANLYAALGPAVALIASDAAGGVAVRGLWAWVVGGGASAALGAWAGKNWDKISAILSVNGADSGTTPTASPEAPAQPDENNLDKIKGNKAADAAAQDAGYNDAHDAKKGRGESTVNIYNDKTTGQKWIWNGKKGSDKEQL